ncbi:hypothetical protein IKP94_04545 [Candidatus Saccharibacteria bacterium]|nr:hypothetical protein [Candidatus Saccharibacteria bacterium]
MDNNTLNTVPTNATEPIAPNPAPLTQPQTPINQQSPQPVIPQNKKSKAPIIIISIIVIILLAAGAAVAVIMLGKNQKIASYTENAQKLLEKVQSQKGENSIYFDSDLEKIDSNLFKNPDGEKYNEESYAIRNTGEAKICLSDNTYRVDNLGGSLQLSKVEEAGKCELNLSKDDIIRYLANYYEQKYDLKVRINDSKKDGDKYIIFTDKGAIYATFELKNKKITIEDDSEELIAGYTSLSDIKSLIINYVNEVQKDKSEDDAQIIGVRLFNDEYFILQCTQEEKEALEFTQKLRDFLVSKNIKNLELYTTSYSSEIVEGEPKIIVDYKIALLIDNGIVTIETD